MCTKAEVREVIRDAVVPAWARAVMSAAIMGAMILLAWLSITTHDQTTAVQELKSSSILRDARLTGRIEVLITELNNIKEVAINRSADRYTGTQARAREKQVDARNKASDTLEDERWKAMDADIVRNKKLTDERCKVIKEQMKEMREVIYDYHKIK